MQSAWLRTAARQPVASPGPVPLGAAGGRWTGGLGGRLSLLRQWTVEELRDAVQEEWDTLAQSSIKKSVGTKGLHAEYWVTIHAKGSLLCSVSEMSVARVCGHVGTKTRT